MINWKPYPHPVVDGCEYAEVGAFVLEAYPSGSWCVFHPKRPVPGRHSLLSIGGGGDLSGAKAIAEQQLREMLAELATATAPADPPPSQVVICTACDRKNTIIDRLCTRVIEAAEAVRKDGTVDELMNLNEDVKKYLEKQQTKTTNTP